MPAPIIAEYGYKLLNTNGEKTDIVAVLKGLQDCVEVFNDTYHPVKEVSYFKAYRSLREHGTYCIPVHCEYSTGSGKRFNYILVIWQVGYQEVVTYAVDILTGQAPQLEKLPLERLIEQENSYLQAPSNLVYTNLYTAYYSKRNHVTGQPNAKEYVWPVEAENVEQATQRATDELRTTGKHQVYIRRVVVGQ